MKPVTEKEIVAGNFSPRSRVIEDEPDLEWFIDKAENDYRISSPEVVLLVPRTFENRIATRLTNEMKNMAVPVIMSD
jgi:hypothetical protein